MDFLDGPTKDMMSSALDFMMSDATLHRVTKISDGAGGRTDVGSTDYQCRACTRTFSDEYRMQRNIPLTVVKVTILQGSLPISVNVGDEISIRSRRYKLANCYQDPSSTVWTAEGSPI